MILESLDLARVETVEFIEYNLNLLSNFYELMRTYYMGLNQLKSEHLAGIDVEYLPHNSYWIHYDSKLVKCITVDNLIVISHPIFLLGLCAMIYLFISVVGGFILAYMNTSYDKLSSVKQYVYLGLVRLLCLWIVLVVYAHSIIHHRIYFEHSVLPVLDQRIVNWIQQQKLYGNVKSHFSRDNLFDNLTHSNTQVLIPQDYHYQISHNCQIFDI